MDEARLFSMVCTTRTRSNGLKCEHWKFHTNTWNFFTVRVMEHWYRLPRGCGISSLEVSKNCLDTGVGTLEFSPALRGLGPADLQRSLLTSAILSF